MTEQPGGEGTVHVEACRSPRRLLLTTSSPDEPDTVIELTLTPADDRTTLELQDRGVPLDQVAAYGAGDQATETVLAVRARPLASSAVPSQARHMPDASQHTDHQHADHQHTAPSTGLFEPPAWEERYSGEGSVWSGRPNPQLVAEASGLSPGTALDMGCGEGGDVIWLAGRGWQVTGADFSAAGLARAAAHAERAGVADRTDWWQVDARRFTPGSRSFDLVTTHFLHPPQGGMPDVTRRLAGAVAPGGHLLVVGHAPSEAFPSLDEAHRRAMFLAEDLVPALPDGFEVLVVEQRPRTVTRDGVTVDVDDSTLLARRTA